MLDRCLRDVIAALRVSDGEIADAQYAALSSQVPLLYLILNANALLLSATHYESGPLFLTVIAPVLMNAFSLLRMMTWLRRRRQVQVGAKACRSIRSTNRLAVALGGVSVAWALSLYPYGGDYQRCHVAFYMAVTVVSCIFCLRHSPRAALLLTVVVVVPYAIFFLCSGQAVLQAMAINLVLVAGSIAFALVRQFADFAALIGSRRELFERQKMLAHLNAENARLANVDSLTELPNRRRFLSELATTLAVATDANARFAVALIDLDGFKTVNDVHGHKAGDRLLSEAGLRLAALMHDSLFLARLGGDEFGAILAGNPTHREVAAFGRSLCEALRGRYLEPDIGAEITGSVGVVTFPDEAETAEQLFERADFALYHAKQTDCGNAVLFSREHERMIRDESMLAHALRQADFEREVSLAYQPLVDAATGLTIGVEALARWTSPLIGTVGPAMFIPAAERINLIAGLTEILLRKALHAASTWPHDVRLGFNLSALDLKSPASIAAIAGILRESGVSISRIDFEITETAVMRDVDQAIESLEVLRRLGARVSLDDFGTGTSSLSHVHRLKPDKIKIDRSFVADILTNQTSRDIVRTIVELCRSLSLVCVVEGVETEDQMLVLRGLGCRIMQGYLYSRPMQGSDLAARLRAERPVTKVLALVTD